MIGCACSASPCKFCEYTARCDTCGHLDWSAEGEQDRDLRRLAWSKWGRNWSWTCRSIEWIDSSLHIASAVSWAVRPLHPCSFLIVEQFGLEMNPKSHLFQKRAYLAYRGNPSRVRPQWQIPGSTSGRSCLGLCCKIRILFFWVGHTLSQTLFSRSFRQFASFLVHGHLAWS